MHVTEPIEGDALASSGAKPGDSPARRTSAGARSRVATRERLLESGKTLFAERGLRKVTTHDIAHNAGVAAGTFYLHFSDKADLFHEIAFEAVAVLRSRLEASIAGPGDRASRVRAHSEALIDFAADHSDLVQILFSHEGDAATVEADVLDMLASSIAKNRLQRRIIANGPPADDPGPYILP